MWGGVRTRGSFWRSVCGTAPDLAATSRGFEVCRRKTNAYFKWVHELYSQLKKSRCWTPEGHLSVICVYVTTVIPHRIMFRWYLGLKRSLQRSEGSRRWDDGRNAGHSWGVWVEQLRKERNSVTPRASRLISCLQLHLVQKKSFNVMFK